MMRREGGRVLIDVSETEFITLMVTLRFATSGIAEHNFPATLNEVFKLMNSINVGNEYWTNPYPVDDEPKAS